MHLMLFTGLLNLLCSNANCHVCRWNVSPGAGGADGMVRRVKRTIHSHCFEFSFYNTFFIVQTRLSFYLVVLRMEIVPMVEMTADQRYAIKSKSHGDIHLSGLQFSVRC